MMRRESPPKHTKDTGHTYKKGHNSAKTMKISLKTQKYLLERYTDSKCDGYRFIDVATIKSRYPQKMKIQK